MNTYFSEEYRDKLVNEHKLVAVTIRQITERFKYYTTNHSVDAVTLALANLRSQKVELEAKLDVLNDFLE